MLTVTLLYLQVCCICPSVLYFPELGQIQHTCAFEVYNIEIKVHLPLISPTQSTIIYYKFYFVCIIYIMLCY